MKWWWPYFLLIVVVLFLLWKLAPARFINYLDRISPLHIGTPRISGTVLNAVTGKPVPGMDVCLLVTHTPSSFAHRPSTEVMRTVMRQTDAAGKFFFDRWDDQRDVLDDWDGYGIAVTDPAARWKDACGHEIYLLGEADIFERETYFHGHSDSAPKDAPPYFPVAMVKDPNDPHPPVYGIHVSFGHFPEGTLIRKIGDPGKLKIAVAPLLGDENECRLAKDANLADLCREMNQSPAADDLRASWKISPPSQSVHAP